LQEWDGSLREHFYHPPAFSKGYRGRKSLDRIVQERRGLAAGYLTQDKKERLLLQKWKLLWGKGPQEKGRRGGKGYLNKRGERIYSPSREKNCTNFKGGDHRRNVHPKRIV